MCIYTVRPGCVLTVLFQSDVVAVRDGDLWWPLEQPTQQAPPSTNLAHSSCNKQQRACINKQQRCPWAALLFVYDSLLLVEFVVC